ncbi:hypothetical protein MNV49_004817 [Pseudohyphozyma bogoriensis]|nr:hypothetical protein MNV49_004817 [Pseudohyphozyma bogoriensis]
MSSYAMSDRKVPDLEANVDRLPFSTLTAEQSEKHPSSSKTPSIIDTSLPPAARTPRRQLNFTMPPLHKIELVVWAVLPLVFNVVSILLLGAAIWQYNLPFLRVKQVGGTALMDVFIMGSCATGPNSTDYICTKRRVFVDFTQSLEIIRSAVPGFAILQLPFYSNQSQCIFLSGFCFILASFALYLPLWTLAYFPDTRMPRPIKNFLRFWPKYLLTGVGALSFLSMLFTITIGMGWRLLLVAYSDSFYSYVKNAFYTGANAAGTTMWTIEHGHPAFSLIWAATFFLAVVTIGINVALHNGLDLTIENLGADEVHQW